MSSSTRILQILFDGSTPTKIELPLVPVETSIRLIKAAKSLTIFWSIAFGSAFVPMLHFVLVPGFILAGFFFALNSYTDSVQVDAHKLSCLNCHSSLSLSYITDQFPKWVNCPSCNTEVKLSKY